VVELAGRLAQQHAHELKKVLGLPGDQADQARTQLQALAQALHHILSSDGEEGGAVGRWRWRRKGEGLSPEEVSLPPWVVRTPADTDVGGLSWCTRPVGKGVCASGCVGLLHPLTRVTCALTQQAADPGGVAPRSGGEAPDPGSRGQQEGPHQHEPRRHCAHSPRPGTPAGPPWCRALSELVQHVLSFLAGGKVEARRDLGCVALVWRSWRGAAVGEEEWGHVASAVVPAVVRRVSEVGARRCVLERSRCHRDRRAPVGNTWSGHLRVEVEVLYVLGGEPGPRAAAVGQHRRLLPTRA
jgi:hypothetical protein